MKKYLFRLAFAAMAVFMMPATSNAQLTDILNKAKDVLGNSSTTGAITNVVGDLLGTSKITEKNLAGTWSYTQPCVAFESENVLSKVGGSVASSKIESKMKAGLEKAGIKAGKMSITFKTDKTFTITVGKKNFAGTYEIQNANVILTFNTTKKSVTANAKISLGTLQLAMNADKMLEVINTIATKASAYSSQMATVSALLNQYKGMYLGLKFSKK